MPSQSVDDVSSSGSPLRRPSKQPLPSGAEKSRTSLNSEESRLTPGKRQPWSQDNVAASTGTTPSASPAKERSGKRRDASYSLRDVSQHSAARLMAYARSATHNFNLRNVALRTSCVIFVDQSRYRTSRSLLSKRSMRIPEECSDTMSAVEAPWQHRPTRVWIHIIHGSLWISRYERPDSSQHSMSDGNTKGELSSSPLRQRASVAPRSRGAQIRDRQCGRDMSTSAKTQKFIGFRLLCHLRRATLSGSVSDPNRTYFNHLRHISKLHNGRLPIVRSLFPTERHHLSKLRKVACL